MEGIPRALSSHIPEGTALAATSLAQPKLGDILPRRLPLPRHHGTLSVPSPTRLARLCPGGLFPAPFGDHRPALAWATQLTLLPSRGL